ncbi:MAG: AarF/ABC1/UbiB kinase family protein [Balneolaceae bacterium]|nr:AarF/ABC1/UbiB kinase family protein [Balneolaceae bacterium]
MDEFPSSKYQRGKIFAKTGLKVGKNYAAHYLKTLTGRKSEKADVDRRTAEEVFGDFTNLRGTALKMAQTFSIDQGFLPEEFAEVMTQAQYQVPPINRSLVRSIIRRELGKYPEQIFEEVDTEAMAAASIGQVHKGKLKDGRPVAVKIQYPGVRDTISTDISLAGSLFKRFVSNGADLDDYIEEIRSTLLKETDYIAEGQSINRFHERFASGDVITPEWIPELSTERVLTMTFIEGVHLLDFLEKKPSQEDRNHFGQILWDFFHHQIKDRKEIHADTHPGNFIFTPDKKLGVVDFGCVKSFPKEFFINYLRLLPTHLQRDEKEIIRLYKELDVLKDDPDSSKSEKAIYEFCKNYGYTFALPYIEDEFNFGDEEYKQIMAGYSRNAPFLNGPRGSKHFIFTTRVHLGLYHFLMKLKARVKTKESREIVEQILSNFND